MDVDNNLSELLENVKQQIDAAHRPPESTYRLQFHAGFTFRDATQIVTYLRDLGITHCYASPYLKARSGSTHGYDIVDHGSVNPEIGSREDLQAFSVALRENELGQVLDTVPNHMGVGTNENAWWNDVLENGPASLYGSYFDISWRASPRAELQDKVLLPVLGDPYGDVLERGELRLEFTDGAFGIRYFERLFPVSPRSYCRILEQRLEELKTLFASEDPVLLEYQSIVVASRNLPGHTETESERVLERWREKQVIKRRLATLAVESPRIREFIEANVSLFNRAAENAESADLLDELLEHQCYRLAYWRVAPDEINYRRFFDINDLAALSMERQEVFEAAHSLVFQLIADGIVDGLRIDHPDGLYGPAEYFQRLQEHYLLALVRRTLEPERQRGDEWEPIKQSLCKPVRKMLAGMGPSEAPLYVTAEKILGTDEPLIETWPIYGTSGYDFLNMVNGLFVDASNADKFTQIYLEFIEDYDRFSEVVYQKKLLILQTSLASELYMLTHQLDRLAQKSRSSRDFTFSTLRRALRQVIACFPVYRSYISDGEIQDADRRYIQMATRRATVRNPLISRRVFNFVRSMLLLEYPNSSTEEDQAEQRRFVGKFQQVTAPVTAKGVEDTAFYNYNRFVSLNEVGGEPSQFGVSAEALHRYNQERQSKWPYALSPLSTHDTKRSEDIRARINVLSELPDEWNRHVAKWRELNAEHRAEIDSQPVPDANEEYLLYQTLVGAWPLGDCTSEEFATFIERIRAYMQKALYEAKVHTSWINPNEEYDSAGREFVACVLDRKNNRPFIESFCRFQRKISYWGLFNSLSQTLLKIASPGAPDSYQGTELWDFSLVDPDNRRPVDYERRRKMLAELQSISESSSDLSSHASSLVETMEDGRIKLYLTYRGLHCRRNSHGLFSRGEYIPLKCTGEHAEHLFAFARHAGESWAAAAVPRLIARLTGRQMQPPIGEQVWRNTTIELPGASQGLRWRNVFTGERLPAVDRDGVLTLRACECFNRFPVTLLVAER